MSKKILATIICITSFVLTGCEVVEKDAVRYQANPDRAALASSQGFTNPTAREVDLVEDMAAKRIAYFQSLQSLETYYNETGDATKSRWAKLEREILGEKPQYKYLMPAEIAAPALSADSAIEEADALYEEANRLNSRARIGTSVNTTALTMALSKYNQIIIDYPASDKIDDSAYKAGTIYQYFGDWEIATTYYQRAFQWNPKTPYPARFKAAWLLDTKLNNKKDALTLYRLALEHEQNFQNNMNTARYRVNAITSSTESKEAKKEIEG